MDRHESRSWWWDDVPAYGPEIVQNKLSEKIATDVCVIGAGIAGMTTAYLLQRQGFNVTVLEAAQVGGGETGRTTAHLSYTVDTWLPQLIKRRGAGAGRTLWSGARLAIDLIENYIDEEQIDCEFKRLAGYVFTDDAVERLDDLAVAAQAIGFSCPRTAPAGLTFRPKAILKFNDQARMHPLKYLYGLTAAYVRMGGRIYTDSLVTKVNQQGDGVKRQLCHVEDGGEVSCDEVVIAAHVPFTNRVQVHTKQASYRTYAIAIGITKGSFPDALITDLADPYHYVRLQPGENEDLLIVGGEDHKTGQDPLPDGGEHFDRLLTYARDALNVDGTRQQSWSGQVIETLDGLPHIGLNIGSDHEYIATGFAGDGMTLGTLAGYMISERIMGNKTPWDELFAPNRTEATVAFKEFVTENKDFPAYMLKDWLSWGSTQEPHSLAKGEGAVMRVGSRRLAVARSVSGQLYAVSPVCTHLGGIVHWNGVEQTWDCPCHGSRFGVEGDVINGPAVNGLERQILDDMPHPELVRSPLTSFEVGALT